MKPTDSRPTRPPGFTLIELLTVIVVIGILAALVLGGAKYALRKAAVSRAQGEIAAMEMALESYKADVGYYPRGDGKTNSSSFQVYKALAGGPKRYMTFNPKQLEIKSGGAITNILDPFFTPYCYQYHPTNNPPTFRLWSWGPDGLSDNPTNQVDDITNWK